MTLGGGHGHTVVAQTHAGSELRSLVAHIRAFHPRRVAIHFRTDGGLATLGMAAVRCDGAALPSWLAERLADALPPGATCS